jgi:glutathione S-transferase
MTLTLYFHPLSSFCMKVLIALYENDTPFKPQIVDFSNAAQAAEFRSMWPVGKFPVLRDEAGDRMIPESSIIIEYLDQHYPGRTRFLQGPMQKIVGDRLRPQGKKDELGVEQARTQLKTALDIVDREMAANTWAMGDAFGMADCAAAPALYYANLVAPFIETHKNATAYLDRLMRRPSFARTVKEAEPYRAMFPKA